MANKKLAIALQEQIAEEVLPKLDMPLALAAKVDDIFTETLAPVLAMLGKAFDTRLNREIKSKYPDGLDAQTRNDIVERLGEALAKKFAGAMVNELKDPAILTDAKKLTAALDELADGYRQFSDDDLDTVFKAPMQTAFKETAALAKQREAEEREKNADKEKIAKLRQEVRQWETAYRQLQEENERLKSSSRVRPSYDPPDYGGGYYGSRSYGGKFGTAAKSATVLNLTKVIKEAYPEATQEDLRASLQNPRFLRAMHGDMPAHSTLSAPVVRNVQTTTAGSFVVCHGVDKTSRNAGSQAVGQDVVALVKRHKKGPNGQDQYSVLGGYINLGTEQEGGEQPRDGAVRELSRKTVNADGEAIIAPDAARLKPVSSGIDYSNEVPISYYGHTLELNPRELAQLKEHAKKLREDATYHDACMEKGGGVYASDIRIMPVSEAAKMPDEAFNKPYELEAVKQLEKELKRKALQKHKQ